jgi:hypothetical protein
MNSESDPPMNKKNGRCSASLGFQMAYITGKIFAPTGQYNMNISLYFLITQGNLKNIYLIDFDALLYTPNQKILARNLQVKTTNGVRIRTCRHQMVRLLSFCYLPVKLEKYYLW